MGIRKYLLVPSCRKGNGTGHLKRILSLCRELKKTAVVQILLPCGDIPPDIRALVEKEISPDDIFQGDPPGGVGWDFIIVDKRVTTKEEFYSLYPGGVMIGIDEGGPMRGSFPYLIDILPSLGKGVAANISDVGFLDLPDRECRRGALVNEPLKGQSKLSILITFGGEDPRGLTVKMCRILLKDNFPVPLDISVVVGPLFDRETCVFLDSVEAGDGTEHGIKLIKGMDSIKNIMYLYDVVITSYGLSAFEAAAARCRVILFNPALYHKRLAVKAGFHEVGVMNVNRVKLVRALKNPWSIPVLSCFNDENFEKKILSDFILSLNPPRFISCPVCGSADADSKLRFKGKTFFTCRKCGIEYLVNFSRKEDSFNKDSYCVDYFFSEYKRQYGKTYLEDFENIQTMAKGRLDIISSITTGGRLLDIGCAYGPFLKEAKKRGFTPEGLEIVIEAARYVEKKLGIPVICSSFEEASFSKLYHVVTMWYVIEHFADLEKVLAKVNKILKIGGVFAFSTPNSSGITGKSNSRLFYSRSPEDHFTVWNPAGAEKVLSRYGFRVKKMKSTGHHPERFPGLLKSGSGTGSLKGMVISLLSRIFKYGDTFEIYSVKDREYTE